MSDDKASPDELLAQFNRLIRELRKGHTSRNTFQRWEVELLLDVGSCPLRDSSRESTLRIYQRAVRHQLERGADKPMKLSKFLRREL